MRKILLVVVLVVLSESALHSQSSSPTSESHGKSANCATIRIITINVWSGLDYHGTFKFGEHESPERRELRFRILLNQLKELKPDILFIQEANPVPTFSSRLADSLRFDEIHQVCNAGVKLLGLGFPSNFEEGIAILGRKDFHLEDRAVWKLSGSFGLFGNIMSVHFDEAEFAQVGQITVGGSPMLVINLHLSAFPPEDSVVIDELRHWLLSGKISQHEFIKAKEILSRGSARRLDEVNVLLEKISELPGAVPVILGGDFNSASGSPEIEQIQKTFCQILPDSSHESYTWDPNCNSNISYSTQIMDAEGKQLDLVEKLSALYDRKPRTIDYIFLSRNLSPGNGRHSEIVLDSSFDGVCPSDHFGVMADVDLPETRPTRDDASSTKNRSSIEPLPILSYDTDTHFGYGAKLFLYDLMKMEESFDIVLFNSTKGEKWYRVVFSIPDFESRQGTEYPLAFDLTFDYDKWLKNNFYGVGNGSLFLNREQYTRVPIEFDMAFSRGFTSSFVGQAMIRHEAIQNFNFEPESRLRDLPPALNSGNATYTSGDLSLRYDTRNSFINPSRGIVLDGEAEFAPKWDLGNTSFERCAGWFQCYSGLFYPTTVFALRIGLQQVFGDNLPIQILSSLGGTNTMRGYPQDRYLDKACGLVNAELRFPIYWRIGGVTGFDAGKVWQSVAELDVRRWAFNPVVGLRLYMDNYVVRADVGFGKEGAGFYLNFGQLF